MRQKDAKEIYDLYDYFIDEFLIFGNSILSNHKEILNEHSIGNCVQRFIDNGEEGNEKFDEKITRQFTDADINTKLVFAHAEWLWAYSVKDISVAKKIEYSKRINVLSQEDLDLNVYPIGFGNGGQWHTNNKYYEISFNLLIIQFIKEKITKGEIITNVEAKKWIENICLYHKYESEVEDYNIPRTLKEKLPDKKLAIVNILTYSGNPEEYERIVSDSHKNQIYQSFKSLLSDEIKNNDDLNLDQKILLIRNVLYDLTQSEFDFYEKKYARVWNYSLSEEGFDEVQGLLYKKAIILYGPPGTSKTYTAEKLANALITSSYLKNKDNVVSYFRNEIDITEGKIHYLQLHPNYTYEDFIVGYQLQNHSTVKTKGLLFSICEAAEKDKGTEQTQDTPHVLILDEINRIDLSRLFGEVLSAIENREKAISLGIGHLKLSIPRNLYIIGTMNEIDFSLEQIDFALKRRFLWYFFGFNKAILKTIIEQKNSIHNTRLKMDGEVETFIANAGNLNLKITSIEELGDQYQIGHTFFGEIVEIYKGYKEIRGYKSLQKQIYRSKGPASILWSISIEPMLKSFLGNMEPDESARVLTELKNIYFSK